MLAGIISGVQTLLTRLTAARAGYMDKLNVTGNITTDTQWSSTRAGYLDKLNITGNVAGANTAVSNATYTSALATQMGTLSPAPKIKVQSSGIVSSAVNSSLTSTLRYFFHADSLTAFSLAMAVDADKKFGLRWAESNATSLTDVVNVSAAGWVLGVGLVNSGTSPYNGQIILIADGTTVLDTTLASLTAGYSKLLIGRYFFLSPYIGLLTATYPMRFNTSLQVQHNASNAAVYTEVVYLLD